LPTLAGGFGVPWALGFGRIGEFGGAAVAGTAITSTASIVPKKAVRLMAMSSSA
jgi:hypothetical protein